MILILGGSGYIGSAYVRYFEKRGIPYRSLSRRDVNYYEPEQLISAIDAHQCEFLINAAGYTGKPNVDACEIHRAECLLGNSVLPGMIRIACEKTKTPWGHVSSGCIYTGTRADGCAFTEMDPPNFCFRTNNSSFYSGSKALGEDCLADSPQTYIWRLRIPFSHIDSPRNYISKLLCYSRLLDVANSISHVDDFVHASYECWTKRVPFGIYHVTNTGHTSTSEVVSLIQKYLHPDRDFRFFENEDEFMRTAAKTPRSNCILDNSKLRATGIDIPDIHTALERALRNWQSST
ncbi:MAG: sugar nucleotide-binding protein [Planctomycetota bacterium]|nr:sugar nucleotide-binding protein [Planctomycetota bacterium]MDA1214863.1 sugar nucleotide-binding protein [Planctomycetota bacterium]